MHDVKIKCELYVDSYLSIEFSHSSVSSFFLFSQKTDDHIRSW